MASPPCARRKACIVCGAVQNISETGCVSFYYHRALAILSNVLGDKTLPPEEIFIGLT